MTPFQIEVIATFCESPQEIFNLFFSAAPSEAEALTAAMLHLSALQRHQLVKFSFCQYHTGETGILSWVQDSPNDLKYYFGESGVVASA